MSIRAFHSQLLGQFSLGTAIGFRIRNGELTEIPAIIVLVAHKVHKQWLHQSQLLPTVLQGPGGLWCDVDVVELGYCSLSRGPAMAGTGPMENYMRYSGAYVPADDDIKYTRDVDDLLHADDLPQGNCDTCLRPGSQVGSEYIYGTLGAIVQSKVGTRQVGFLTTRHVAVDLEYPNQKLYHPLPPNLGPGVYLGTVERATSFATDDLWYGVFASMNPETFVRADGAFIPFQECFDLSRVRPTVNGFSDMGEVMVIDLQAHVGSIVGKHVVKVGQRSSITKGQVMAYAFEYNDDKGVCFLTDLIIIAENKQSFDPDGDSGSLILVVEKEDGSITWRNPRPVGIISRGGIATRGSLKLCHGHGLQSWTSGVDLGRLLNLLQLSLITSNEGLMGACQESRLRASGHVIQASKEMVPCQHTAMQPSHPLVRDFEDEKAELLNDHENHHKMDLSTSNLEFTHNANDKEHSEIGFVDVTRDGIKEPSTSRISGSSLVDLTKYGKCKHPSASKAYGDVEEFSVGLQLSSIRMQREENVKDPLYTL